MSFPPSLRGLIGRSGVTFTDVLTNGGGTPVETFTNAGRTTAIANYQGFQRGKSNIVLYGKYSVAGGTPTGFAWRCGAGPWVRFINETIGAGNWQGTLAIPSSYLAQGAFQVKPINGLNVTPSSKADISITDIYSVGNGQSNGRGLATNAAAYSGSFKWICIGADRTGLDWPQANIGSCWPKFAMNLDAAGIPPVFVWGAQTDGTGFSTGDWTVGASLQTLTITRHNANLTGGYAGFLWDQGEQDCRQSWSVSDHKAAFMATLNDWRANINHFADVPVFMVCLGDYVAPSYVGRIRQAVIELANEEPLIYIGAPLINEVTDGAHYGTLGNDAQRDRRGDAWFRAIAAAKGYGGYSGGGEPARVSSAVVGSGADANKLTIAFDRAMQNHANAAGWVVKDGNGILAISSAAQGVDSAHVVLTFTRDLYGTVLYSFGTRNFAAGSTLKDTGSPVAFPPLYTDFTAATGVGEGSPISPTIVTQYAHNGSTAGVHSDSAGALTGSIADPDGGTNALRLTSNIGSGVQVSSGKVAISVHNGLNFVSFKIKKQTWAEANAFIRLLFVSFGVTPVISLGLNDGSITSENGWIDPTFTDIGSGWYQFSGTVNMANADLAGSIYVQMANTSGGQVIDQAVAHSYDIYDFKVSYI
jgi:hypothetical protein